MTRTTAAAAPAPLIVAAGLVLVEAIMLLSLGVVQVADFDADRAALGVTTSIFFVVYAAALGWFAWACLRGRSWARAPIVLAQLIQILVAWSFRSEPTTLIAVALIVVALVALAGVLHPTSIEYLADDAP